MALTNSFPPAPPLVERLKTGLGSGWQTSLKLIKFVLPLYVAVDLLKGTSLMRGLGELFAPMMGLFGLPGETAFAFIAAFLLNLYAALAILAPLELTPWQITQCGLMMGIAHNLLVEGGVLRGIGTSGALLTALRLAIAAVCGIALHLAHILTGG
jgi:spore maturation protein SpmB